MTHIKICGIKTTQAAVAALEAGADMLGFVFYRPVRRYIEPERAAALIAACRASHARWQAVGVFVDEPLDSLNAIAQSCGLDLVQLNGSESPDYVRRLNRPAIKVIRNGDQPWSAELLIAAQARYPGQRLMVDTHVDGFYGGTGIPGDWQALHGLLGDHILAGGLRPETVAAALQVTGAWGVDVSSGVERDGEKDPQLIREFIAAVRSCRLARSAA